MGDEEDCNTGLSLGLGVGQYTTVAMRQKRLKDNKPACSDLMFTLCSKEEKASAASAVVDVDDDHNKLVIGSSLKTRGGGVEEEEEDDGNKTWESNNYNSSRKKLRLTKEQLNLLEDSLKLHTTLNSSQKQSLAEELNLKPRQVEVWFQNRRSRMKSKQAEGDCEFLRKCCESLTDENKRLKKELQELKSLKAAAGASPLFIQLQTATDYCPSCKKL